MEVTFHALQDNDREPTDNFINSLTHLIRRGHLVPGKHRSRDWFERLEARDFRRLNNLLSRCDDGSEEALSQLISLTAVLCYLEEGPDTVQVNEERLPDLLDRVTMLASLEELRRTGVIEYTFPRLLDNDPRDKVGITMLEETGKN